MSNIQQPINVRYFKRGEAVDLAMPEGVRALLVTADREGNFRVQEVHSGASVLDIKRDLINHMRELPLHEDWYENLLEYLLARRKAQVALKEVGSGFIHANQQKRQWTVHHVDHPAFSVSGVA